MTAREFVINSAGTTPPDTTLGNKPTNPTNSTTPPTLVVTPIPAIINNTSLTVSGTTEAGASVTVKINDGTPQPANVIGTSWTYGATLVVGANSILITAADAASNSAVVTVTTTVESLKPAKVVSTFYDTLTAAYGDSAAGAILAREYVFVGDLTLDMAKNVIIRGGYNADYTTQTGYTTMQGKLTIGKGSLVVDRVVIK